jgi:hypothetical protein
MFAPSGVIFGGFFEGRALMPIFYCPINQSNVG